MTNAAVYSQLLHERLAIASLFSRRTIEEGVCLCLSAYVCVCVCAHVVWRVCVGVWLTVYVEMNLVSRSIIQKLQPTT